MRQNLISGTIVALFAVIGLAHVDRVSAVELLISGNFETPGGLVGDVPGWALQKFATGSAAAVNSAELTGGSDPQLFLRAFEGGGPLRPAQANFNDDGLPAGFVNGTDFLIWQRGLGIASGALPSEGDAGSPGDGKVDGADLATWKANFKKSPLMTNARLTQTVPGSAGEVYSFSGSSMFEDNYSGFVSTLGAASPFGQIPSPTTTTFRMEFLNGSNIVIGSKSLDLRTENTFPGFPFLHNPITDTAPVGTVNVRVTAEALNMVYNGTETSNGALQSAFFNDFSLTRASSPGTQLLTNADLNLGAPDALDFWNQVETPATRTEILRTPIASWANHTPGGTRGVFLSAFFGAHPTLFEATPVDGVISQTVQAIAGGTYTFSGWTKFEANYSGGVDSISAISPGTFAGQPSPTQTLIKLEFLDVNQAVLSTSLIDAKAARRLISPTGIANDNLWHQHTLQAISPTGTRFARLTAIMDDGVFNVDPGQSAFFDDFSLDGPPVMVAAVPEPASIFGLALGFIVIRAQRRRR